MAITLVLFVIFSLYHAPAWAQEEKKDQTITVSGRVIDETEAPVLGATVLIKGQTRGVVTDREGRFTIKTEPTSTLVISFIGMTTKEVAVNSRTNLSVKLTSTSVNVSDIVVIGYGTQSRATVTTSISKITGDDMATIPSGSPLVNIQGKIPGVDIRINSGQPGATPAITIRGGTSIAGNNSSIPTSNPLYIIDGVIRPNMSDINSNDIASIEVLKDAASTAVYGSRAANGIVIVTTKSGKKGTSQVNFKYTLSVETQPALHPLASARDALWAERNSLANYFCADPGKQSAMLNGSYSMGTNNPRNSLVTTAFLDDYITKYGQAYTEDLLANQHWETMIDPANPSKMLLFKDTDFQDELFQTAISHDCGINFSGGNDNATYYASFGYLTQEGIVIGSNYSRWNALLNGSYKIRPNLTVSGKFDYTQRKTTGVGNVENVMARGMLMPRTMRLYYEDGLPAPGEMSTSFRSRRHQIYYQEQYNQVGRMNMNFELDWEIIKGLHLRPTFSFYNNEGENHNFERANEIVTNRPVTANHDYDRQWQYEAVLSYNRTLGQKHNLNAMAGGSYIYTNGYDLHVTGNGGTSDYIETMNGTAPETVKIDPNNAGMSERKTASLFARVTYDFDSKYMLAASLRYDGSSHFAANKQWGLFPGISAGWNIHREHFWEPISRAVSNFKLRLSYGMTGNDNIGFSDANGLYDSGYNYMGQSGIRNTKIANLDLLWESTTALDGGLDIGFLNNRINLMVDLYRKETKNRLIDEKLAVETGFNTIKTNYGTLINRGIEFGIDATAIRTKDFSWQTSFTFSYVDTRVGKLPNNGRDKNRINGGIIFDEKLGKYIEVGGLAEGERPYPIYGYKMDGVYATDSDAASAPWDAMTDSWWLNTANFTQQKSGGDAIWRDLDKNNVIDEKDLVLFGYITPDIMGAFVNTFRYKNLSLRIAMDYAAGHMISNDFNAQANAHARENFAMTEDVVNGTMWQKQGDNARLPRLYTDSDWGNKRNHGRPVAYSGSNVGLDRMTNSAYVSKGDYIAFREVTLNYTLHTKWLRNVGIDAMDLMAGVYNLGYITAYDGLTPEQYGPDRGNYPRPRTFMFSVNIKL